MLFRSLHHSFFPRQILIYWPWIFFFLNVTFWYLYLVPMLQRFFFLTLVFVILISTLYFNATFSSFLPLFYPQIGIECTFIPIKSALLCTFPSFSPFPEFIARSGPNLISPTHQQSALKLTNALPLLKTEFLPSEEAFPRGLGLSFGHLIRSK